MSELAILKKIKEAEEIFKPATPDELKRREESEQTSEAAEMYATAEQARPGSLEVLRRHYKGNEALVLTAIAYSDCGEVSNILRKGAPEPGVSWENDRLGFYARGVGSMRNLDWHGVWTDAETFVEQAKIIAEYNAFDVAIASKLAEMFPDKQFRLGREGSVAAYIRPFTEYEAHVNRDDDLKNDIQADEFNFEGNTLRIWWD